MSSRVLLGMLYAQLALVALRLLLPAAIGTPVVCKKYFMLDSLIVVGNVAIMVAFYFRDTGRPGALPHDTALYWILGIYAIAIAGRFGLPFAVGVPVLSKRYVIAECVFHMVAIVAVTVVYLCATHWL
jgi:hypothetical protein